MNVKKAKKIIKGGELSAQELLEILTEIHAVLDSHEDSDGLPELCDGIVDRVIGKYSYIDEQDEAVIYLTAVKAYYSSDYPWRARKYAERVEALLDKELDFLPDYASERWYELGEFYISLCANKKAQTCFSKAYEAAESAADKGYALAQYINCCFRLGEEYASKYTDDELKEKFPESYKSIKDAMEGRGYFMKRDPIENSEKFQKAYDEMSEAVYRRVGPNRGMGHCFLIWDAFSDECIKRGIYWSAPPRFNPGMMID